MSAMACAECSRERYTALYSSRRTNSKASLRSTPRAAIGRGLLDYLDLLETPPVDELTRDMVERCRALIYVDQDDGIKMLHVLSKTIVKRLDVTSHRAYEWVSQQQKRFHSCGNKKMITYYGRLMNYFRVHGYNDIRAAAVLSTMGEGSGDT